MLEAGGSTGTYSSVAAIEKEHMFDKVVTPSDVGKLNRLVIPKQHAEKYFPLDSSTNEKGLLLNFEDRNGKPWRFRYSYWNSSQSYVMTKGWSRFVKEKKLDAGDIISFQRGVGEAGKDRLFIDWRRRPDHHHHSVIPPHHGHFSFNGSVPWGSTVPPPHPFLLRHGRDHPRNGYLGGPGVNYGYGNVVNVSPCSVGSLFYLSRSSTVPPLPQQLGISGVHGSSDGAEPPIPVVFDSVPIVQGKAAAKRLRLFGVNMDCPIPESSDHHQECEILPSTSISHAVTIGSQPPPHQVQLISSSSPPSQSQNPHPQLRLYNGMPLTGKDKAASSSSSMSFDLDI
ncbi:hypothetical protein CDL15_Pgr018130 [Punica granatum]|nr:hypothetical protein CDL15_Pgr018130 [Punica granatum]